ncbi:MAG: glycosyltransferase family 39 protein [Bacillota bacterium]|nr:glycosyltransferase family 39 protein [Bacillota bacterium]
MKKLLFSILAVFVLTLSMSCISTAEGTNLLKNPGFEDADKPYSWDQDIWEASDNMKEIKVVNNFFHSGKQCASITNKKEGDSRLKQTIDVKPDSIYKISGWIKTDNVGDTNKGANLSIMMLQITSADVKGTTDWKLVEMYGRTGKNQNSLTVTAGLGGYGSLNTGTAYFDDITVEQVANAPVDANVLPFYSSDSGDSSSSSNDKSWLLFLVGALIIAIGAVLFFVLRKPSKSAETSSSNNKSGDIPLQKAGEGKDGAPVKNSPPPFKLDKKDLIIMGAMTLIYLIIALINLGDMSAPESVWRPASSGESFVVTFDKEQELSKIGYYDNIGDGKYNVQALDATGNYINIGTMNQDVYNVFRWQYISDINVKTKKVKVTVDSSGAALNEMTFYAKGSKDPIKGIKIEEINTNPKKDLGKVENLFDEQNTAQYYNTYKNSTYFDEIYHPRTAYENIHRMEPYETTHPPLGKVIMALGVLIFGMNPFGWRIMGTLFGALMVPAMYMLGKKVFHKKIFAFISAFLMMFDFMHFAQTRIGTIDSYPGLFIILTYFFMYDAFMKKSYKTGFKNSLKPLLLAGVFWGLGSASKWTDLYAGFGLAILFFTSMITEILDWVKAKNKRVKGKLPLWTRDFVKNKLIFTPLACVIFFIVIPGIIYVSSYLPIITLPGPTHNLEEVVRYQKNMYDYHAHLKATHPYQSEPWQWAVDYKPLLEYRDTNLPAGKVSLMYTMGNPIIFWFGLLSVFAIIILGLWKRDKRVFFILVAYAIQYLPWFLENRGGCVFIYHYFTAIPFLIMALVYLLKFVHDDVPKLIGKAYMSKGAEETTRLVSKCVVYGFLALVAIFFIWFYPAISGWVMSDKLLQTYKWLHVL